MINEPQKAPCMCANVQVQNTGKWEQEKTEGDIRKR